MHSLIIFIINLFNLLIYSKMSKLILIMMKLRDTI